MMYIACLVIILVLSVLAHTFLERQRISYAHIEHFAELNLPLPTSKIMPEKENEVQSPMTIYYTNDLVRCDFPMSKGIIDNSEFNDALHKVDYSFDVEWYKHLLEYYKRKYKGFSYPKAVAEIVVGLDNIIENYNRFPAGPGSCKVTIPNWGIIMPKRSNMETDEQVLFGDINNNAARGSPRHWAFAGHLNPSITLEDANISFVTSETSGLYKIKATDGKQYVRASLNNFSKDVSKKLYCSEVRESSNAYITFGLRIDPKKDQVTFIKNNKVASIQEITDWDISRYFTRFFVKEEPTVEGDTEIVVIQPTPQTFQISRIMNTICDIKKLQDTPAMVWITFNDTSEVKPINLNKTDVKYYRGTKADVANKMKELDGMITDMRYNVDEAYNRWSGFKKDEQAAIANVQQRIKIYWDVKDNMKITANAVSKVSAQIWNQDTMAYNVNVIETLKKEKEDNRVKWVDINVWLNNTAAANQITSLVRAEVRKVPDDLDVVINQNTKSIKFVQGIVAEANKAPNATTPALIAAATSRIQTYESEIQRLQGIKNIYEQLIAQIVQQENLENRNSVIDNTILSIQSAINQQAVLTQRFQELNTQLQNIQAQVTQMDDEIASTLNEINTKHALSQTAEEEYNTKLSQLNYHIKLKGDVNNTYTFMSADLIRDTRNMIVNGSMRISQEQGKTDKALDGTEIDVPEDFWKYLSYDGNLYVVF